MPASKTEEVLDALKTLLGTVHDAVVQSGMPARRSAAK
jgi:hypothetical protein